MKNGIGEGKTNKVGLQKLSFNKVATYRPSSSFHLSSHERFLSPSPPPMEVRGGHREGNDMILNVKTLPVSSFHLTLYGLPCHQLRENKRAWISMTEKHFLFQMTSLKGEV